MLKPLLFAFFAFSSLAQAGTREVAHNIARERFLHAQDHLSSILFTCRAQPQECAATPRELTLMRRIYFELLDIQGTGVRSKLVFASEAEAPGTFMLDGQVRIAKTGSAPGTDIYINTDLIVREDLIDGVIPFTVDEAVAVLVHEYGHHHHDAVSGDVTHEELDLLGAKVRQSLLATRREVVISTSDWPVLTSPLSLTFYSIGSSQGQNQEQSIVHLAGPFGLIDLGDIANGLTCPRSYYMGDLNFEGHPFKIYFKSFTIEDPLINAESLVLPITVDQANVFCLNHLREDEYNVFDGYRNGMLRLPFSRGPSGDVQFDRSRVEFSMTTPPDIYWQ